MLLGPFATFCHLDVFLHNLDEHGLAVREGSHNTLLHVRVQVPSVLLLFSHLCPKKLVRLQTSDGLEGLPEATFDIRTRGGRIKQLLMNLSWKCKWSVLLLLGILAS